MTPRLLVILSVLFEALTGLALVALPQVAAKAFLAAPVDAGGAVFARLAGIALICLALMAWAGRDARPAYLGMLAYNLLAAVYIVVLGLTLTSSGVLLWPAAAAHVALGGLMLLRLNKAGH